MYDFFYKNARFVFSPSVQDVEIVRKHNAEIMKTAHEDCKKDGITFKWEKNKGDSSWPTWTVILVDKSGRELVGFGNVDLGQVIKPVMSSQRLIYETELAMFFYFEVGKASAQKAGS